MLSSYIEGCMDGDVKKSIRIQVLKIGETACAVHEAAATTLATLLTRTPDPSRLSHVYRQPVSLPA
jgi:hypothetical protein